MFVLGFFDRAQGKQKQKGISDVSHVVFVSVELFLFFFWVLLFLMCVWVFCRVNNYANNRITEIGWFYIDVVVCLVVSLFFSRRKA